MLALGQLEFTGHDDAASEIDEAAAAFGLQIVEPAREVPEWHLWPDLVPALHLWNGALTQWRTGYSGPCPATGTHRYRFRLFALDSLLTLRAGIREGDLLAAMEGHILATGELTGRYRRHS